jgi:trans-aconitate 2-methyltransferase
MMKSLECAEIDEAIAVSNYTFGDTGEASSRLRRLADLYEPETRALLTRSQVRSPRLAVDLGCGPGWTTQLVYNMLQPQRTVGIDASQRFIGEARKSHGPHLEFHVADVVRDRLPAQNPDVLFCRFLLTHLSSVADALESWIRAAAPGATLFIHETESLQSENPAMDRYYELVAQLQRHYGQALYIGALLEAFVDQSGWRIVESSQLKLKKRARKMAELHLSNLRTWRNDEYAKKSFDAAEIHRLEGSLGRIAGGEDDAGVVVNVVRQIIARKD